MDTTDLIAERGKTHGDFEKTAVLADTIRNQLKREVRVKPPVVSHGIDMICVKLARIASGDPTFPEHWDDIAGYAKLVADWLREQHRDRPPHADR